MLKLGYKELFSDLGCDEQYPIEAFANAIPKIIGTSREIIHLDFSGIDGLSDEVFFVLKQELKITQKQNVEIINLTGCCHITDRGIELLAQAFSNLKELILIGCTQLTQLSLNFILANCPKLDKLSAQFTNIAYLSNAVAHRWGEESIVCNPLFKEDDNGDILPLNLVILVMDTTIECDIGHYLCTGKIEKRDMNQPIIFQKNALNINDVNINIIQLFCPTVYMAPFICDRSLFVIATDVESDTSNAFNIIKGLDFIRGVVYCCPIQIIAFSSSPEPSKLEELAKVLQSFFIDQQINMKEHLDQEHYSKSLEKDYIDQWRYVQSLSAIDPEHISLHLLGLSKSNENCNLCYCSTICESSTAAKIEQTISDFFDNYVNVKDSLDRINKADINETKSYSSIPAGLEKIIETIIKLFNKEQTVKQFLNDPLLLSPLREYKSLSEDENPEKSLNIIKENFESKEDLEKNSRGVKLSAALGLWILAKWNLCEKLAPLKIKLKEFELLSQTRNEVKTPYELVLLNMRQNLIQLTKYMYNHIPSKVTKAMSIVINVIDSQKSPIIRVKDIYKEFTELKKSELYLVLNQIQRTGKIIFINSIGLIITDILWFIKTINMVLCKWKSPINDNRVWFITSKAVISTREELITVISDLSNNDLCEKFFNILEHYGLFLPVKRSWNKEPQNWEPINFTENLHKILYVSWHQLSLKPDSNTDLVINNAHSKSTLSERTLHEIFPDYNSPEFNINDISFKFSFKFRIGIPCNLFCQIVSKIALYFRTILLWSQGILIREGAVEILIFHNIHASRGSSSFDIESRILGPIDGRRPVAVREHMWGVLSQIITIIEASIVQYPHLHHKVRHYCRGQCFKELDQENTFAEAQVSRTLISNYDCSKCRDYQMYQSDWLYVIGRHMFLPNHKFEKGSNTSCKLCWIRKPLLDILWKSQQKIFPIFGSKVFYSSDDKSMRGNIIMSGDDKVSVTSDIKCMQGYLQHIEFKVVDPSLTKICLNQKVNSKETEIFSWNLEMGDITTNMREIKNSKSSVHTNPKYPIKTGDTLSLFFMIEENDINIMLITNNNNTIAKFIMIRNAHISFYIQVNPSTDESNKMKLLISNTDAAVVTCLHFRPGMIVLLKGETKWEPAVISGVKNGKLNFQLLSTIDANNSSAVRMVNNQWLPINSINILPPGFYPSEINSTLDSRNQRSMAENWYKILSEYSEYMAAPFGLFQRLTDEPLYQPLNIFGDDSRECITSCFHSDKILKMTFFNKPISSRTQTSYLPLPFPFTPMQLLMPQRNIISHNDNHALHRLCSGSLWKNYSRDMHPMNEKPYQLKEGEAKYFFQGDFSLDVFIIIKNFSANFSAIYQNIDHCFPHIDPSINKDLLRDAVIGISKAYRDILLFDIVSKIKMYNNNILSIEKKLEVKNSNSKLNLISNPLNLPMSGGLSQDASNLQPWTEADMECIQKLLVKKDTNCESHVLANNVIQQKDLGAYCQCIANIVIKRSTIDDVKNSALITCTKLRKLEVDFGTMPNINWIVLLPMLSSLTLSNCGLHEIGNGIDHLKNNLKQLSLDGNPIREIPDSICDFIYLNNLQLNNTLIVKLPHNIGNLKFLKYLSIEHTKLSNLPESFSELKSLTTLRLSGIGPPTIFKKNSTISLKDWTFYCNKTHLNGHVLKEKEIFGLFETFNNGDEILNNSRFEEFKSLLFESVPRFKEFPIQIFSCISIQTLVMSNQAFETIPDNIQNLKSLKKFIMDGCMNLQTLSSYVGQLPLEILALQDCDNLKTPPYEIRKHGMRNTIAYLLRLVSGSEACYRTKLMLVGLGGAGKTSLMRALTDKNFTAPQIAEEAITDGIDINSWSTKPTVDITLKYSIWDFAGQTLYYNTHQFFLTGRSIYLLIWNVRQGFEHAGLDFWLNSISCHAPLAPIFIVGTHSDKVDKSEIPSNLFQSRYPSVVGFYFISSLTGKGVKELHDKIIEETLKQPYIGEIVPNAWLRLEKELISQRTTSDYLNWESVKNLANNNAIYDEEITQAVRFLHDLGSIQYFEFPLLKDILIINSQWLVDVMACVVSVKNSIIINGRLEHSKIKNVWSKYPESIHKWLLRLTEIFDLTFSVPGQNFNFIPCLLPNEPPDFVWPDFVDFEQIRESNMLYQFEYLPPGLFNRAQVRLSQFSDTFIIWQHGSLLNKDGDKALMKKLNDTTVKVCARGFWPDNILFIVHEMFETLIAEAFSGVNYEYQLACKKCVAERDTEPYLFNKSILQRAIQSKTIFIQCHRNFHITTMKEIQESTPPDSIEDYDLQFKKSIRFISANRETSDHSTMILVSEGDYKSNEDLLNIPKKLVKDLKKNQYIAWCEPLIEGTPEDKYIDIMTRAEVIISIISGNFTNNKLCMNLFKLSKTTLRKNMILVRIDKNYTNDTLGLETAGDKYINFERVNVYDQKFNELLHDIKSKIQETNIVTDDVPKPRVFVSYCWDNSQRSFNAGNSKILNKNAIGWGDPRTIKDYIEQKGLTCWLDVEMIGSSSVYSEITSGLRHSEVVVACLSNEYAQSDACKKEFMFARQNLNLPIIIAEVGISQDWNKTEIGLLSIEYPKICFQSENPDAFEQLFQLVSSKIPEVSPNMVVGESVTAKMNRLASQEDFELIQRKIFRLLSSGFGSEESRMYPRLFFIDISDEYNENNIVTETTFDVTSLLNTSNIQKFSLCFRILCESESGWHTVDDGIPLNLNFSEQQRLLQLGASYLYRITLLLKFSEGDNIKLFNSNTNEVVTKYFMDIFENNAKSWSYMKPIHSAMRNHLMRKDVNLKYGGLQNCCLNNGKTVWLCNEHSNKPYISVLGSEESDSLMKLERRTGKENEMSNDTHIYSVKDNSLIDKMEDILKEYFSDTDSSVDNRKSLNETNKFIQSYNMTTNVPKDISGNISFQQSKTTIPSRKVLPPLEVVKYPTPFQSKTCLIM